MNLIFRFADLEVDDLSKLNSIDASPDAKRLIEKAQKTAAHWQARFTLDAINKNEQLSYEQRIQLVRDMRQEIKRQIYSS